MREMTEMREMRDSETVSECGRKIPNANRMPKSDDRTESNLRRGRREGGREGGRKTRRRRGGEGRWGGGRGERGEGRGERGEGRGERGKGRGGGGGGGLRPEKSGVRICTRSKETLLSQE